LAFKTANTEQQATLCHFWQAARGKESPGSEEHSQLAAQNAIPSGELRFGISKLAQFLWQGLWFLIFFSFSWLLICLSENINALSASRT